MSLVRSLLLATLLALALTPNARADWPSDPSQSVNVSGGARVDYWPAASVPDGSGGVFVTFSALSTQRLQHLAADGRVLWPDSGIAFGTTYSTLPPIADGAGGVIVIDARLSADHTFLEAYARRFDGDGNALWGATGVSLAPGVPVGLGPASSAVSDGAGGAIVALKTNLTTRAQRISAAGALLWGATGVEVHAPLSNGYYTARTVADGTGGGIFLWYTQGDSGIVRAQRLSPAGIAQWGTNGVAVTNSVAMKWNASLVPDGQGGAIVGWHQYDVGVGLRFLLQRLSSAGTPQWDPSGAATMPFSGTAGDTLLADGIGGVFIATSSAVQHVQSDGSRPWPAAGITLYGQKSIALGAPTALGIPTAIVLRTYFAGDSVFQTLGHHLGAQGEPLWDAAGVVMHSSSTGMPNLPSALSDGNGGLIGVWLNSIGSSVVSVGAARVDALGRLGTLSVPPPTPPSRLLARVVPDPMRVGTSAAVRCELPRAARVSLRIRDLSGRRIRTIDAGTRPAGAFSFEWRGDDDQGRAITPGIYFVELVAGTEHTSCRIVALK